MFAAARGASALARSARRMPTPSAGVGARAAKNNTAGAKRTMGGGAHWMEVSQPHTLAGEVCGFFTWLWVFHRAHHDLPVVLGMRHPWEHGEDPFAIHHHVDNLDALEKDWEEFSEKNGRPGEDDDDDDDDEDDDEDEDGDDE